MAARGVARHFGRVASDYARWRHTWPLGALRRQEEAALQALVQIRPGDRVLDVGCGGGDTLAWLAAQGARAVGVDLVWAMARACRDRGLAVCVQDMEHLAVRPGFDWVLCIGALEFVSDPGHVIRGLAACLRQRGRLALLVPRRTMLGRFYALYHRAHGVRIRLFSHAEVGSMLAAAGLRLHDRWRDGTLSSVGVAERVNGAIEG